MRDVYRYEVPVDDREHVCELPEGTFIVHVDCREIHVVEFWAEVIVPSAHSLRPDVARTFKVFGTGHPIGDEWVHRGTALTPEHIGENPESFIRVARGSLVWHLYEKVT